MMFILRSIFWLTLMFVVLRPGAEAEADLAKLADVARTEGAAALAGGLDGIACADIACHSGKAMLAAGLSSVGTAPAAPPPVPLPRPRPQG